MYQRSSSVSSSDSNYQNSVNRIKSPVASDYEYLGRLVTRERPIIRKEKAVQQKIVYPRNSQKNPYTMASHRQQIYEDESVESSEEDIDDPDGLTKPLGVIRISDRHFREIYRLPTPPPKIKRVYHRLRSPEPKVIERVYVRRPPPQIIENVIEVPQEKVRIINREKFLDRTEPVTRSKLVHLKSRHQRRQEQAAQQEQEIIVPSQEHVTTVPLTQSQQQQQQTTTLVYPPQPNMRTVGYIKSTVPPHIMFNTQQPLQLPAQQLNNSPMVQQTPYTYPTPQATNYQMVQPTSHTYIPQQPQQQQQMMPNSPYGYTQY